MSGTPNSSNVGNSFFIILRVNVGISPDKEMFTLSLSPSNSNEESNFFVSLNTLSLSTFPFMIYRNGTRWKISLFLIYTRRASALCSHGTFIFWVSIPDVYGCPLSSML